MLPAESAISRFRRDLTLAALLRGALITGAALCMFAGPLFGDRGEFLPAAIIIGLWVALSYRSLRGSRLSADSPSLIAAGEYDRAERHIDAALRTFSLFRTSKLLSMHHLALLRHAQRRWRETCLLTQALLSQRLGRGILSSLRRTTLLMQADAMLQLEDLRGAADTLGQLHHQHLNLNEALTLQLLQLDYESRIGAFESMLNSIATKIQLSELMPSLNAARSQALMAVAAKRTGRLPLAVWLRRRSELLADTAELTADRPVLVEMSREVW